MKKAKFTSTLTGETIHVDNPRCLPDECDFKTTDALFRRLRLIIRMQRLLLTFESRCSDAELSEFSWITCRTAEELLPKSYSDALLRICNYTASEKAVELASQLQALMTTGELE
jgi:hypothetical protein